MDRVGGDKLDCPSCGKPMKKNTKNGTYVCDNKNCTDKFIAAPLSIFGVTSK